MRLHVAALLMVTGCASEPGGPGTEHDGGIAGDAMPGIDASGASRCTRNGDALACEHETLRIDLGAAGTREVHHASPVGTPPARGWPTVILFQGSFYSGEHSWAATPSDPFNSIRQTEVVQHLLDHGYAVITPETRDDGNAYWDTNTPAHVTAWETADDHELMQQLFGALDAGELGALSPIGMLAAGISSGGYMSSRVGISYPGRFAALAVVSASYMTCGGSLCRLPDELPDHHPPTLFLHGDQDAVAPIEKARAYFELAVREAVDARWIHDPSADHEWLDVAPVEILAWADRHLAP